MRDRFSKSMVGVVLSVILTMAFGATARAQADELPPGRPAARTFTGRDGLPQASAMGLTTDSRGYLWIATQDGAARFNGRVWTVFNMPDRTVSNFVRDTVAASDGSVWFGRQDGGAARLAPDGSWESFTNRNGLPDNRVNCVFERKISDTKSEIWLGTNAGGIAVFADGRWMVFNRKSGQVPSDRILCFAETVEGAKKTLWIGTGGGLARFDGASWEMVVVPADFRNQRVRAMFVSKQDDGSQALWVGGSDGGLARLARGEWASFKLPSTNFVNAITETRAPDGVRTLWVGTDGDGVHRFSKGVWSRFDGASGLPNMTIWSFHKSDAPDGNTTGLWIGTDGGLMSVRFGRWTSFDSASGLRGNSIYGMFRADDGRMWFGTRGEGLFKFEKGQWSSVSKADGLPSNTVFSVYETRRDDGRVTVWAGTQEGLSRNDGSGWRWINEFPEMKTTSVRGFVESDGLNGRRGLWVVTSTVGLLRFEDEKWSRISTADGLPTNQLHCLLETRNRAGGKVLWVGTETGGLARFENGKWRVFNTRSGLPNNTVMSLQEVVYPDGKRLLWAGTEGSGVCVGDLDAPDISFRVISDETTPAIPNNTVYQVRADARNRVYLFTNKGVARLTRRAGTENDFDVEHFTGEDGLVSEEFNGGASFRDSAGRVWGGTPAGAVMFDPGAEVHDSQKKPIVIEQAIRLGEMKLPFVSGSSLSYTECNLAFEFALLGDMPDSRFRYRTQLVGFESEPTGWSTEYRRSFTNLPAGDYRFQVWGRDEAGIESGPVEWRFSVRPAPWLTWWAYVIYFVLAFGLVYGGVQARLRALRQRTIELEAKVTERTSELAEAVEELKVAKGETEKKNEQLIRAKDEVELKNLELDKKNQELDRKIEELVVAQKRADRIFSALAEALPGTVLDGKYRLDEKIGAGGFGAVFKATHLSLGKKVAVKVFRPAPGNDTSEAVERFRLEGISASRVNHPNAVAVLDSGVSTDGIAYLVMELLDGHSLGHELRLNGKLSLGRCAAILKPLCEVLEVAHSQGIIHRDIKPDNIFLHQSPEGEVVKVVDFGIAKMLGENSEGNSDELTLTGSFVGTPIYMSPERFNRQPFDGRADVYSVAVLAFEMLCGRPPFVVGAAGPFALIMDHLQTPPPLLRAFHSDFPQEIEEIVQKGLSKDPDERPSASMFGNGFWLAARQYVSVDEPGLGPTDGGGFEDVPTASGLKTPPIITLDTDSRRISRQTGSWKDDSISSGFFSDDPAEK